MQYVAFLRGINIGKVRRVKMSDLKLYFEELGFTSVSTYINSGNVIFNSDDLVFDADIERLIEKKLKDTLDFDIPVMVRSKDSLRQILDGYPFLRMGSEKNYLIAFTKDSLNQSSMNSNSEIDNNDSYLLKDGVIYLYCHDSYLNTKYGNNFFEKKYDLKSTMRSYKVIQTVLTKMNQK